MSVKQQIRQLGGETLVYGLGGTLNRFIALFLIPIYTRVFSTDQYGIIATFNSFIGGAFIFIILGLDAATARWFYDQEGLKYRRSIISSWFWFQIVWGLLFSLIAVLLARPILNILAIPEKYSPLIYFVSGIIFLNTFSKVTINTLRLGRHPWATVIYTTASTALTIGGIIFFVLILKKGLNGFYIAQITMALIIGIIGVLIIRSWISPRLFSGSRLKEMLSFGIPIVPVGVFQWITMSSDRILLGNLANASEVGIYAIAYSLTAPIGLITTAFTMAYSPFSMSLINHPSSRQVYSKVFSLYIALGCFVCTAISIFAADIVDLVTTPKYHSAASCIPFLAFAVLMSGAMYIAITGLTIAKKSTLIALGAFTGAAFDVGLNFILIPHWKKQGAAFSLLISTIISLAIVFFFSQKRFHIPYQFGLAAAFITLSAGLIGIDILFLQRIPPSLGVTGLRAGICLAFLPLMFWLKILRKEYFRPFLQFFIRMK